MISRTLRRLTAAALGLGAVAMPSTASLKAHFPMALAGSQVTETVSGNRYNISANIGPMGIGSPTDGDAWRTDGYTTYIQGSLPQIVNGGAMSAEVAFAIDTNAIIGHDDAGANNDWAKFIDCTNGSQGFAFMLGRSGQFAFKVYVGGTPVTVASNVNTDAGKLQLWQWYKLRGEVDGSTVKLYLNDALVGTQTVSGSGVQVGGGFILGRDNQHNELYALARQADFNGAIDYLKIWDDAQGSTQFTSSYADLNLPADRYKDDPLRAKYHGQPGMNWTNETHGLMWNEADGKYHVIFQRTGSAPVMSHAHYGHITSGDLFNWSDDKPMIWPSENWDRRGCWSGCLFKDAQINGGKPAIIYTGVEYGTTSHAAFAYCDDPVNLRSWHKPQAGNPISTYGNVARDTYFFRVDDNNAYFIIGDAGRMRSYKWAGDDKWTDNGDFYNFQAGESGFTEMPNVAKLPNGKWLMTYTPYTGNVQCIYRIGDIDGQGRFVNFTGSQLFDCFARDGFCLMSPSIGADKNGKLVSLGIVADKMATEWNIAKGYAHLYSLPRTLDVDNEGRLLQRAFDGHEAMRGTTVYESTGAQTLDGALSLNPVRGREVEVEATFTVGDNAFGINFLQNNKGKGGKITYTPSTHTVSMDVAAVVSGDYGMKNASYQLPVYPAKGEEMKLHLFIDHSVADLFINDRYATSFRVFPDDINYDLLQVYSDGPTTLKSVGAWMLGQGYCSASPIEPFVYKLPENSGAIGFIKSSASVSEQEQGALSFFTRSFKSAAVLTTADAGRIKATDFDCLWLHIDRKGISQGYQNLPGEFLNENFINALKQYVADGGNLMVTGQATQLLVPLGRIAAAYAPNIFASGDGGDGNDQWTVYPVGKTHQAFANMETSDAFDYTTFGLLWGGGAQIRREDHNCMWEFNKISYKSTAATDYQKFEEDTHSSVIGTWGQEKNVNFGGMIQFYPMRPSEDGEYGGTIIANGLAACQWTVNNGTNAYAKNLELMTANLLAYLAPADPNQGPVNPGGDTPVVPEDPDDPETPGDDTPETLESTGKVALYVGYADAQALAANKQEQAALDLFKRLFPEGTVLYSGDVARINAEFFDCVWIHAERDNLAQGWNNLPDELSNEQLVAQLRTYVQQGGNLYLSKHASQLAVAIGRTDKAPAEWGNTDPGAVCDRSDKWQTNVHSNGTDWSSHLIFSGLELEQADHGKLLTLLSPGHKHYDRNCMWKLNDFGGHDSFCNSENARVLGTWGHNGGQAFAGIIEFLPTAKEARSRAASQEEVASRRGTVVVNGLAAYQLTPVDGTNPSQGNIDTLTGNILTYLSPVEREDNSTSIETIVTDQEGAINLRGNSLYYQGFEAGTVIEAYSADGRLLRRATVAGAGVIELAAKGVVIVRAHGPQGTVATKGVVR